MDIIVPNPMQPATTGSTTLSIYPTWDSGTAYQAGTIVFDSADSNDYRANYYVSTGRPRPSEDTEWRWTLYGSSAAQSVEVDANIDTSEYPDWSSGVAVVQGQRVFDQTSQRDFEALLDIASGDNTLAPSVSVASFDATINSRWFDLGVANAYRMFDGTTSTRTTATQKTLEIDARGEGAADAIVFTGLQNVWDINVVAQPRDFVPDPDFVSNSVAGFSVTPASGTTAPTFSCAGTILTMVRGSGMSDTGDFYYLTRYAEVDAEFEYTFSANLKVPVDAAGKTIDLRVTQEDVDGALLTTPYTFDPSTTYQDQSLRFTAPLILNGRVTKTHRIAISIKVPSEFPFLQLQRFSLIQTSVAGNVPSAAPQNLTAAGFYTVGEYSGKSIIRIDHTPISNPAYELEFEAHDWKVPMGVGYVLCGAAIDAGCVEADVTTEIDDYSGKVRDETYGTVRFIQRGFSKRYKITLRPSPAGSSGNYLFGGVSGISGDEMLMLLTGWRGRPIYFDANLDSASPRDTRLQVYGFYAALASQTSGTTLPALDQIRLEIEGLVE